jgi:hypothetical protein
MIDVETEAQRVAEQLGVGDTRRGICPSCQGGDKHETSWVVGREADRVWFKCFRANCTHQGVVGAANLAPAVRTERHRALERIRPYTRPIYPLEQSDWCYFRDRFEIDANGVAGVTDSDEYILPVNGWDGQLRGHVVRQPVWKGMPKAPRAGRATYWDADNGVWAKMPKTVVYPLTTHPLLAWYTPPTDLYRELVIVEDQISAAKVSQQGCKCVALLGNGMNIEMVRDILRTRPFRVTIALDPGAEGQAQNIAKKWGLYFERTRVVALEADPKDILAKDLISELGL